MERLAAQHEYLYGSAVGGMVFIWRPLTRAEYYRLVSRAARGEDVAYEVCRLAVLYPEDIDYTTLPGGVVTRLADDIWRQSAMPSTDRLVSTMEALRQQMESFERQAECAIAVAFPGIRIEEMMHWPIVKLLDYAVRAEWVLNRIHGLPVRFTRLDAGKEEKQPTPAELRKKGIDPMLTLDPAKLRPKMTHDLFIVGTSGWRLYNCSPADSKRSPQPRNVKQPDSWELVMPEE